MKEFMNKREKTIAHILEILHPVLLTAIVGPMVYAVCEQRVDAWILPLYLAAFSLLPLSSAVRISVRKVRSIQAYILISFTMFAATIAIGKILPVFLFASSSAGSVSAAASAQNMAASDASLKKIPSMIVLLEMILGGSWIAEGALRLRVRENRRRRARMENDHTWQEKNILSQKPGFLCLSLFIAAYLMGLLNACPPLCNIAIGSGAAYLIGTLVYRSMEVLLQYLQETENLVNVPQNKIRRIRGRILAALIITLCIVSVPTVFTADGRRYRDLRKMELVGVKIKTAGVKQKDSCIREEIIKIPFGLGISRERHDPPGWLLELERFLAVMLFSGATSALVFSVWRSLTGVVKDFREMPEENGDIATRLEDITDKIGDADSAGSRLRRFLRGQPLTEQEKIRREYRRTIRRYRKEEPQPCETPAEIENGTDFPEGFDVAALHERYEKARYECPYKNCEAFYKASADENNHDCPEYHSR